MQFVHVVRKTLALALFGVLVYLAGKDHWLNHDYGSVLKIVSLVALIVGVVVMLWLVIHHSSIGTVIAFAIGLAAFWFCEHEFQLKTAVHVVVLVVIAFILWVAIIADSSMFGAFFNRPPSRTSRTKKTVKV
jgi:hypothetical protein